jgi:acyl carrier protein
MNPPPTSVEDVRSRVRDYLRSIAASDDLELTDRTPLVDYWFTDSIRILETVVFLENAFGIEIDRADVAADNFETLETLVRFVVDRLKM